MRILLRLLPAALLCAAAGCSRETSEHAEVEAPVLELFEKGKGLRLPDDMMRTLGVETTDVVEKAFHPQAEFAAKVYQRGRASTPGRATALLDNDVARALKVGQAVVLQTTAGDSNSITGQLTQLDTQANGLGQLEALIEFPDADGRYAVGSSLLAVFTSAEARKGFAVPVTAVLQGADTMFVYTVNGAHFVRTPVKPGARSEGWVEILDGLYAGDVVVARGGGGMWMIELCALKGGTPCCPVGKKPGRADN